MIGFPDKSLNPFMMITLTNPPAASATHIMRARLRLRSAGAPGSLLGARPRSRMASSTAAAAGPSAAEDAHSRLLHEATAAAQAFPPDHGQLITSIRAMVRLGVSPPASLFLETRRSFVANKDVAGAKALLEIVKESGVNTSATLPRAHAALARAMMSAGDTKGSIEQLLAMEKSWEDIGTPKLARDFLAVLHVCMRYDPPHWESAERAVSLMVRDGSPCKEWEVSVAHGILMRAYAKAAVHGGQSTSVFGCAEAGVEGAVRRIEKAWNRLLLYSAVKGQPEAPPLALFMRAEALARCVRSVNEMGVWEAATAVFIKGIVAENQNRDVVTFHVDKARRDPLAQCLAEILRATARLQDATKCAEDICARLAPFSNLSEGDRLANTLQLLSQHARNESYQMQRSDISAQHLESYARNLPAVAGVACSMIPTQSKGLVCGQLRVLLTAAHYLSVRDREEGFVQNWSRNILMQSSEPLDVDACNILILLHSGRVGGAGRGRGPHITQSDLSVAVNALERLRNLGISPEAPAACSLVRAVQQWGSAKQRAVVRRYLAPVWDHLSGRADWPKWNTLTVLGQSRWLPPFPIMELSEAREGYMAFKALQALRRHGAGDQRPSLSMYTACLRGMARGYLPKSAEERAWAAEPGRAIQWILCDLSEVGIPMNTRTLNMALAVFSWAAGRDRLDMSSSAPPRTLLADEACEMMRAVTGEEANPARRAKWLGSNAPVPADTVTYNTILKILCLVGLHQPAIEQLERMTSSENCKPDLVSFYTVIVSLSKEGDMAAAEMVIMAMINAGLSPAPKVVDCILRGYVSTGNYVDAISSAQHIFNQHKCAPSGEVFLTASQAALQAGDVYEAKRALSVVEGIWGRHGHIFSVLSAQLGLADDASQTP
jgi:hypothetical protein